MHTIISRNEAHALGLLHFFTGKECTNGHIRERSVSNGSCLGCLAMYARERNTKYRKNGNANAAGLSEMTVPVHPQHRETLANFARLLELAVVNGTPAPLVPAHQDVPAVNTMIAMLRPTTAAPPPPPPTMADDPYPTWVRIHGQEIADQIREMAR